MKKIFSYIISLTFLVIALSACRSECYVQQIATLKIGFLDSVSYKAKNISGLTVIGLLNDSILYNNTTKSSIELPLHSNQTQTVYRLILPARVNTGAKDTILLNVDHTPKPQLVSPECGCVMFHTINDAKLINNTYNFKMQLTNPNVVNDGENSNIKILH